MTPLSDEAQLARAAESITEPTSRRVFLQLAAAAGASLCTPLLAACGGDDSPSPSTGSGGGGTKTGTIAEQVATLANDYWGAFTEGFKEVSADLGCKTQQLFHDNAATKELAQVRGAKATGTNMLIGTAAGAGEVPLIGRTCQTSQIYYVPIWENPAWFTPQDVGDYFVMYQTPPSEIAGYESAKALFDAMGGEGKVVHIPGLATPTDAFRGGGVKRAAKEFPGIKLVTAPRGDFVREKARSVMLNMVSAHPDMKGVFAQNDSMALGVMSVLRERKMTDVKFASVDGLKEAVDEISKGGQWVASHASLAPYQAGFAAVTAFDAFNGWKPSTPERMMYTGSVLITKNNAAEVRTKVYGTTLPWDWKKMSRTLNKDTWDMQNEIRPIDPEVHWKGFDKDLPLNAAWAKARDSGEFDRVTKLYADHNKVKIFEPAAA